MIPEKKYYLTKEGLIKVKAEYNHLKKLRSLKTKGESPRAWQSEDLNPEYLSFQEDIAFIETRLIELNNVLKNVNLIRVPPKSRQNVVNLGATVLVSLNGNVEEFTLVGSFEADAANNKISNESPVGQALMERRVGETIKVVTPLVNHSCEILKIKYN